MTAQPTFVLAHGGLGHGPWQWSYVIPQLRELGFGALAHDRRHPTVDGWKLRQDRQGAAERMHSLLDAFGGKKVLVGHSGGGAVVTDVGGDRDDVVGLVYICTYMDEGGAGREPSELSKARTLGKPLNELRAAATEVFFHDCDPRVAAWATDQLVESDPPAPPPPDFNPSVAWQTVPAAYVVTTRDRAIEASHQRLHARRATVTGEIATGHSPFFANPTKLARLLVDLAQELVG